MRLANRFKVSVALTIVVLCGAGVFGAKSRRKAAPTLQICDVLRTPAKYAGRTVTVVARLTSMKEGTIVWASGCPKLGVIMDLDSNQGAGLAELSRELRKYGLSSHPVVATLTGVLDPNYYDKVLHRKYSVFKVTAARDIHRSPKRESFR